MYAPDHAGGSAAAVVDICSTWSTHRRGRCRLRLRRAQTLPPASAAKWQAARPPRYSRFGRGLIAPPHRHFVFHRCCGHGSQHDLSAMNLIVKESQRRTASSSSSTTSFTNAALVYYSFTLRIHCKKTLPCVRVRHTGKAILKPQPQRLLRRCRSRTTACCPFSLSSFSSTAATCVAQRQRWQQSPLPQAPLLQAPWRQQP